MANKKNDNKKEASSSFTMADLQSAQDGFNEAILKNSRVDTNDVMRHIIRQASGTAKSGKPIPRMAFIEDPTAPHNYAGIYKIKRDLIPDQIIKNIRVHNFIIASILRARGNTLSMFGRIRRNRFDIGLEVPIKPQYKDYIDPDQMIKVKERIERFIKILSNCGHTDGLAKEKQMTLPEFLDIQTRNGLSFGRFSTEIIYRADDDGNTTDEFHRFRPVDVATIYPVVKNGETAKAVRASSIKSLSQLEGVAISTDKLKSDRYAWVQAINGQPKQAFTADEMMVYNLYPSSDIEHNGYPVTPIDTVMISITTHNSIEEYNKLYFQNGRASKGIFVLSSDDADQAVLEDIKQQFSASINNVTNSFRTPIFGIGKEDSVQWVSTQPQRKDGEFQFLFDQVIRNILSAFNMSPDELPGFTHLSRGTNQQSLSESNNEYKLIAARDTGIRPLILRMQDFINEKLFPVIDPELAQLCTVEFAGFDAETKQEEAVILQQNMSLHMNYDEIMENVEKDLVGPHMGGKVPFNERYRTVLDQYANTGKVVNHFFSSPAAIVDPLLKYKKDEFWFKWLETLGQHNPEALAAYMATRKDSLKILKMYIQDYLHEEELG